MHCVSYFYQFHKWRINWNEYLVEEQIKNINITGGGDLDTLALEKRLTIFKLELDKEYETIAEVNIVRENLEEIRRKVNLNENEIGVNKEKINDILKRLKNMEQLLHDLENALANKIDREDFDKLYQLIANQSYIYIYIYII